MHAARKSFEKPSATSQDLSGVTHVWQKTTSFTSSYICTGSNANCETTAAVMHTS